MFCLYIVWFLSKTTQINFLNLHCYVCLSLNIVVGSVKFLFIIVFLSIYLIFYLYICLKWSICMCPFSEYLWLCLQTPRNKQLQVYLLSFYNNVYTCPSSELLLVTKYAVTIRKGARNKPATDILTIYLSTQWSIPVHLVNFWWPGVQWLWEQISGMKQIYLLTIYLSIQWSIPVHLVYFWWPGTQWL